MDKATAAAADGGQHLDRYKALLDDYYGVKSNGLSPASGGGPGSTGGMRGDGRQSGIDDEGFLAEDYVQQLLTKSSLSELLKTDDSLVHGIRALDSDMQLLVYDNYSKFLRATDTIRNMRGKVDKIEDQMKGLSAKMESIAGAASKLNDSFSGQRSKIEKLVRLQGLISKLNFLFELPERLRECVAANELEKCVAYYNAATPFLQKYSNVASFAAISSESRQLIMGLKDELLLKVEDASLNQDEFNQVVSVLQLLFPEKDLSLQFVNWYKNSITKALNEVIAEAMSLNDFVTKSFQVSVDGLSLARQKYTDVFLNSKDDGLAENVNEDEPTQDERLQQTRVRARLMDLTKSILDAYFTAVHSRFTESSVISRDQGTSEDEDIWHSFGHFQNLLRSADLELENVRVGTLPDRGVEVVEAVVRQQVVRGFEELKTVVKGRLQRLLVDLKNNVSGAVAIVEETGAQVISDMKTTLDGLHHLLASGNQVLSEMEGIFNSLVALQLRGWIAWLCQHLGGNDDVVKEDESNLLLSFGPAHAIFRCCSDSHFVDEPVLYLIALASICEQMADSSSTVSIEVDMQEELHTTKEQLVGRFVYLLSSSVSMRTQNNEKPWLAQTGEPKEVSFVVCQMMKEVLDIYKVVSAMTMGEENARVKLQRSYSRMKSQGMNQISLNLSREDSLTDSLRFDIERMFAFRIKINSAVKFQAEPIFQELVQLLLKGFIETLRLRELSVNGLHQFQVDLYYVQKIFSLFVSDMSSITKLCEQVMKEARSQCVVPSSFDAFRVEELCEEAISSLNVEL